MKADSIYKLIMKFFRNKNAGDGVQTHDLQISEVKWSENQIEKGEGCSVLELSRPLYGSTSGQASSGHYLW